MGGGGKEQKRLAFTVTPEAVSIPTVHVYVHENEAAEQT